MFSFESLITELKRRDLYNMNETNFRINIDRAQTIIIIKSYKRLLLADANNQNYIISIKYISVDTDEYALLIFLIIIKI